MKELFKKFKNFITKPTLKGSLYVNFACLVAVLITCIVCIMLENFVLGLVWLIALILEGIITYMNIKHNANS